MSSRVLDGDQPLIVAAVVAVRAPNAFLIEIEDEERLRRNRTDAVGARVKTSESLNTTAGQSVP